MIVIFEGLDGVGKTTLCKELCKRYNFEYIKGSFTDDIQEKQQRLINLLTQLFDDKTYIYDRCTLIDDYVYAFLNTEKKPTLKYQGIIDKILSYCKIIHVVIDENKRRERFDKRGDNYITNEMIEQISKNYVDYYKSQNNIIYILPLSDNLDDDINKIIPIIKE